jgi:hypothetical protein
METILLRSRSCDERASRKTSHSSRRRTAFHFATISRIVVRLVSTSEDLIPRSPALIM